MKSSKRNYLVLESIRKGMPSFGMRFITTAHQKHPCFVNGKRWFKRIKITNTKQEAKQVCAEKPFVLNFENHPTHPVQ